MFPNNEILGWGAPSGENEHDQTWAIIGLLARKASASLSRQRSGRIQRIELAATRHGRAGAGWKQEWTVRDAVDCPDLDSEADFYARVVAVTDLNGDGRAEVTIPYHLFCGGGIEPSTVKIILREGATKLAIRGESLVRLPGQEPFGGERRYDPALLQPRMAAYKRHLDGVWQAVAVERGHR